VDVFASFQRDASGRPAYAIAAVQGISERTRLDEELRQAKETLVSHVQHEVPDALLAQLERTPMSSSSGLTASPSRYCAAKLDNETWPVEVESGNVSGRHHHKIKRQGWTVARPRATARSLSHPL
jgi:hypothetical protein